MRISKIVHCGPKNCHPFSFHYSFYKFWPISIIFGVHYIELVCNTTTIDLSTSPTYCCCTTLGKLICCFWLSWLCASEDQASAAWNSKIHSYRLIFIWPLNTPDLRAVDYRIWGVMQDRVNQTPIRDVADLRQCLIDTWNDLSQSIVDDAVDEWRNRDFRPVWLNKEDILNTCCNILG